MIVVDQFLPQGRQSRGANAAVRMTFELSRVIHLSAAGLFSFSEPIATRAVDPAVDALDNVYRYDMDALAAVTKDTLRHRRRDFIQCCTMVDAAALRLEAALRSREAGGVIAELEEEYLQLGEDELVDLEHRLQGLSEGHRDEVNRTIRRLVRKFLHMPVRALRRSEPGESEAVRRAFSVRSERKQQ